jgi:hypothetical protein
VPRDLVKDCPVFFLQVGVKEEPFDQSRVGMPNGLPVGRAEVTAKHESYLEEQVVGEDVRECSCHVWMVLDLTEAELDVIGVYNNVIIGV